MPSEQFLYYADTANTPYGTRDKALVRSFITQAFEFIASHQPDAAVIACNTATSIAVNELRARYRFPIIGMEPAVKPAVVGLQKRVLVTATSLTLKEQKLNQLMAALNIEQRSVKRDLDGLVLAAEQFDFNSPQVMSYLKEKFKDVSADNYDAVVLGCTHFSFYKSLISQIIGPKVRIIDGNEGTVRHLMRQLSYNASPAPVGMQLPDIQFFSSGVEDDLPRQQRLRHLLLPALESTVISQ